MRLEHAAQVRHRQPGKAGTSATASDTHARLINPARKCFGHTGRGTGTALVAVALGLQGLSESDLSHRHRYGPSRRESLFLCWPTFFVIR